MSVQHVAVRGQHEPALAAGGDRTLLLSPMSWRNNSHFIFQHCALLDVGMSGGVVGRVWEKNPLHSSLLTPEISLVLG